LPFGWPGIGVTIEGAMQQAAQAGRQGMGLGMAKESRMLQTEDGLPNQHVSRCAFQPKPEVAQWLCQLFGDQGRILEPARIALLRRRG
jgi:hypothetical protein